METQKHFRIAVRGLVYNDAGQILLLRRSRPARGEMGYWELPGGGLDHGESPQQALAREVLEETCLQVSIGSPLVVWDYNRSANLQIIGMTFACHHPVGEVLLSNEHDQYEWVTLEAIPSFKVFPELIHELAQLRVQGENHVVDNHQ